MQIEIDEKQFSGIPKWIDFNYVSIKAELAESLLKYNGETLTDDANYKKRKEDRARLNALAKSITAEKSRIKSLLLAPMKQTGPNDKSFDDRINDLVNDITRVVSSIDDGIKKYEDGRKEAKLQKIIDYVNQKELDIPFLGITRDEVYVYFMTFINAQCERKNNAWMNVTCSFESILDEIDTEFKRISEAAMILSTLCKEEPEIVKVRSTKALVNFGFDLVKATAVMEECKNDLKKAESVEVAQIDPIVTGGSSVKELYSVTMRFVGTLPEFQNLKDYLEMNKSEMKYKVIGEMVKVEK